MGLLDKFIVPLLYAGVELAVLPSAVFRQTIFGTPLKKAKLVDIEVAAFLLGSGGLLNCAFLAFVFFLQLRRIFIGFASLLQVLVNLLSFFII